MKKDKVCSTKMLFLKFLKNTTRVSAKVCFKRELKSNFSIILQAFKNSSGHNWCVARFDTICTI